MFPSSGLLSNLFSAVSMRFECAEQYKSIYTAFWASRLHLCLLGRAAEKDEAILHVLWCEQGFAERKHVCSSVSPKQRLLSTHIRHIFPTLIVVEHLPRVLHAGCKVQHLARISTRKLGAQVHHDLCLRWSTELHMYHAPSGVTVAVHHDLRDKFRKLETVRGNQ